MYNLEDIRPTYLEVNIDRIIHNIDITKDRVGQDTELMGVVKGDLYGLGIRGVFKYLEDSRINSYGVATLNEALELRRLGTKKNILILGYTPISQFKYLIEENIFPTIYTYEDAKALSDLALEKNKVAGIHIKVDTGMHRIGFDLSDGSIDQVEKISKLDGVKIEGIFSHFVGSEEIDKTKSHRQAENFLDFCKKLEDRGVIVGKKHMSNSGAVVDLPEYKFDLVRNGYNITGLYDPTVNHENLPVILACQLKTIVARVAEVEEGEGIGYNSTFVTDKKTKIATLPIGYTDGYKKQLSNRGQVQINGQRAKIRGTICMDQMMVDVSDIDCKVGDPVIVFGYEDNAPSVLELSQELKTGNIDIISNIARRVPRVYVKDGKIVDIVDYLLD